MEVLKKIKISGYKIGTPVPVDPKHMAVLGSKTLYILDTADGVLERKAELGGYAFSLQERNHTENGHILAPIALSDGLLIGMYEDTSGSTALSCISFTGEVIWKHVFPDMIGMAAFYSESNLYLLSRYREEQYHGIIQRISSLGEMLWQQDVGEVLCHTVTPWSGGLVFVTLREDEYELLYLTSAGEIIVLRTVERARLNGNTIGRHLIAPGNIALLKGNDAIYYCADLFNEIIIEKWCPTQDKNLTGKTISLQHNPGIWSFVTEFASSVDGQYIAILSSIMDTAAPINIMHGMPPCIFRINTDDMSFEMLGEGLPKGQYSIFAAPVVLADGRLIMAWDYNGKEFFAMYDGESWDIHRVPSPLKRIRNKASINSIIYQNEQLITTGYAGKEKFEVRIYSF